MWFTLVVDDFGIKYIGKKHSDHLLGVLNKYYNLETDWEGALYCGVSLAWNYNTHYMDIHMPNYVYRNLIKYKHEPQKRPQHFPYKPSPKMFGKNSNKITDNEESPSVGDTEKLYIQQVPCSFQYCARAVDVTILHALSTITKEQVNPTEQTLKHVKRFLYYISIHKNAIICYCASDMILNVHSDASFQTASREQSLAGGYFSSGVYQTTTNP